MSNAWFTTPSPLVAGTDAKAEDVNEITTAAEAAFDLAVFFAGIIVNQMGVLSGVISLDVAAYNLFNVEASADIEFDFSAPPLPAASFVLQIKTNGYAVTWPDSVLWANNVEPAIPSTGTSIFVFYTLNNGSDWIGALSIPAIDL